MITCSKGLNGCVSLDRNRSNRKLYGKKEGLRNRERSKGDVPDKERDCRGEPNMLDVEGGMLKNAGERILHEAKKTSVELSERVVEMK